MKLNKVFENAPELDVQAIMFDSRKKVDDSIFFAMKGKLNDGHKFIDKAIENGAICIVYTDEIDHKTEGICYLKVADAFKAYVTFCNFFYDHPLEKMNVIGITGTNGKTTIAWIIRELIAGFRPCGYIGTMGYYYGTEIMNSSMNLTSPKSDELFRIGKEMYDLPDGGALPDCPAVLHLVQLGGQHLYLQYGMQNFCYRWCVEDGVEFGWRVKNLRLMLRCALLNHEWNLAQKFIDMLRQTRNHAQWAEEYQPLVGHPELIAKHKELGPITHVKGSYSVLASDQSLIEKFMLTVLSSHTTDDPIGAELVLVSAIQLKDIQVFWRAFNQYAITHPDELMPRVYQEVAYLYGHLENGVDISRMPFEQSVKDDYEGFMALGEKCKGMTEAQMRSVFYPKYGRTFYYNYFLVRGLRTY